MMRRVVPVLWCSLALAWAPLACDGGDGDEGGGEGAQSDAESPDSGEGEGADTSSEGTPEGGEPDGAGPGGPDILDPDCGISPGYTCNPLCHTGCDLDAGQRCLFAGQQWQCLIAGEGGPGSPCSSSSECASGACIGPAGESECAAPCLRDEHCADAGLSGAICNVQISGGPPPFRLCGAPPPPCDLWAEDACEKEGEACYPSGGGTMCSKSGSGGPGDACANPSACLPGHTCVNLAGTSGCVRFCQQGGAGPTSCASMCGAGGSNSLSGNAGVGFCADDIELPFCNPLDDAPCGANQGCYLSSDGWICMQAGIKEPLETCSGVNQCAPGLVCQGNMCRRVCNPGISPNNPKCGSPGTPCVPLAGAGFCDE